MIDTFLPHAGIRKSNVFRRSTDTPCEIRPRIKLVPPEARFLSPLPYVCNGEGIAGVGGDPEEAYINWGILLLQKMKWRCYCRDCIEFVVTGCKS